MDLQSCLPLSTVVAAPRSTTLHQKVIAALLTLAVACCYATFATAQRLPSATTQAAAACGQVTAVTSPAPFGISASCDHTVISGRGSTETIAHATASLGPGFPLVGAIDAEGTSISRGVNLNEDAETYANGNVTYYFQPNAFKPLPFLPTTVPVFFEASAQGHSDVGVLELVVTASGLGLTQNVNWVFNADTGGDTGSFNNSAVLSDGIVNGGFGVVTVSLDALCGAGAFSLLGGPTVTDECAATVDPTIEFDQAAFDATYGGRAFQLSDYFNLDFSANVPTAVPEPRSYALMLFGLGAIGFVIRRGRVPAVVRARKRAN